MDKQQRAHAIAENWMQAVAPKRVFTVEHHDLWQCDLCEHTYVGEATFSYVGDGGQRHTVTEKVGVVAVCVTGNRICEKCEQQFKRAHPFKHNYAFDDPQTKPDRNGERKIKKSVSVRRDLDPEYIHHTQEKIAWEGRNRHGFRVTYKPPVPRWSRHAVYTDESAALACKIELESDAVESKMDQEGRSYTVYTRPRPQHTEE